MHRITHFCAGHLEQAYLIPTHAASELDETQSMFRPPRTHRQAAHGHEHAKEPPKTCHRGTAAADEPPWTSHRG